MRRVALVLVLISALLIAFGFWQSRGPARPEPDDPHDVTIDIPPFHIYGGASLGRQLDISPDGKKIVYAGSLHRGSRCLFIQTIGENAPVEIPGTDVGNRDIRDPTFSPDGHYIAYWAQGTVRTTTVDGATVSVFGKATTTRGIAWLSSDTLVLGNPQGGLLKLGPTGEEALPLVAPNSSALPHVSPAVLPGSKAVIFTIVNGPLVNARIAVVNLETGEERQLFDENAFAPRYVSSGQIVFGRGTTRELAAVGFDPTKLKIVGSPQPVLKVPISGSGAGGATDYAISETGVLVYTPFREEGIYDFVAWFGGLNLPQIHIRLKWFEELNRRVP